MWSPGIGELTILLVIVVIMFGAGKAPNVLKDCARSVKEFRNAVKED